MEELPHFKELIALKQIKSSLGDYDFYFNNEDRSKIYLLLKEAYLKLEEAEDLIPYFQKKCRYSSDELKDLVQETTLKFSVPLLSCCFEWGVHPSFMFEILFHDKVSTETIENIKSLCCKHKIDISKVCDSDGNTLLHIACRHDHLGLVEYAHQSGISVDTKNLKNQNFLEYGFDKPENEDDLGLSSEMVEMLINQMGIKADAIISAIAKGGWCYDSVEEFGVVFLLLKYGGTIEKFGNDFFNNNRDDIVNPPDYQQEFIDIHFQELQDSLDAEILQIIKGVPSKEVLYKWNAVFKVEEAQNSNTKLPNLFQTPYHMLKHAYERFEEGMQIIFKKTEPVHPTVGSSSLNLKVEIFAALAHTTEIGRQQALQIAQMDTQELQESLNKKHKI